MTLPAILSLIPVAALLGMYVYRYWKWVKYLWWKWRMIPLYEQAARRSKGLCEKCGYDLRGTPERCPECGELRSDGVELPLSEVYARVELPVVEETGKRE